jgi:heavy metal sensor kinase
MKSFRVRLLTGLTALVAAACAVTGLFVYLTAADTVRSDIDRLVQDRAFMLARSVAPYRPALQPWMESFLETDRQRLFVQLFDADGALIAKSANLSNAVPLSETARRGAENRLTALTETVRRSDGEMMRLATFQIPQFINNPGELRGFAQAGILLRDREARLRALIAWLVVGGIGTVGLTWGVAALLLNHWLRTINAASESAHRIGTQGRLHERLFIPAQDDELARLAITFNELLDRLETAYNSQQRLIADASHELRTPLTVLRGEIEVALRRERTAGEYRDVLQSAREEIERLSRLAENLLALARVDAGEGVAAREPVELAALCHEVVLKLAPVAQGSGIAVSVEASQTVEIPGDRVALEQVFANLVENAIRYSPRGESVTVRIASEAGEACVTVSDTGPGIPAEHLPHLCERFYRVDKARSREHGGAGLGLAIVKTFVEAHGGRLDIRSAVGSGSAFTVFLPLPL